MDKDSKIYIAGHNGMVGSSILRNLKKKGFRNLVIRDSSDLDLTSQAEVNRFFEIESPDYIFMAAAKVGGILANDMYKAEFIYENMMIQNNIIHHAYLYNIKKLLFLGSSCIYPRLSKQPIKEEYLLTGALEKTNEPYAIAKISGIKMCEAYRYQYDCNFISAMPCNLFGKNDNYDLTTSHLIPALLRKFYDAKKNNLSYVEVWGDGTPRREFLHVDDCADACIFLMLHYNDSSFVNIGTGIEHRISEIAEIIKDKIGFKGIIRFNTEYPNGTERKVMDITKLHNLGWKHSISFEEGIDHLLIDIDAEIKKTLKS